MAFTSSVVTMCGLCEIVLPNRTIRLCDGGIVDWPAVGTFTSQDDYFGTIGSFDSITETIGDEAPSIRMTMYPSSTAAAADLAVPTAQGSPLRLWLAEIDGTTGALVGTPNLLFTGVLESLTLRLEQSRRSVEMDFTSQAERLFSIAEGNVYSPRWHKSIWSTETGLDHATGVTVAVAWGVATPPRGTAVYGGFTGGLYNPVMIKNGGFGGGYYP